MWYIIPKERTDELYHHGIKGQKWGVRNGPPYPLDEEQKSNAFSSRSLPTVQLPAKEYAHVMSEIATHITNEQRNQSAFIKNIGQYTYHIENNQDNTYRIVGKFKIR